MKVILKQDVEKLGRRGDVVNVAPGFGRNYLIPRKMALAVTADQHQDDRDRAPGPEEEGRRSSASPSRSLVQKLNEVSLTFTRRAGEKDVIFGSVSAGDVKEALDGLGYDIDKKKILLDEPIKRLGNFTVPVKISTDDRAEVKIVVAREEAEGPAGAARRTKSRQPESPERRRPGRGRIEVAMELDMMFLKKTPPHSLEAERTVLGGILVQNQNLNVVLSTISPEDLYMDAHRKILERIIVLVDKGLPVDLLTLTEDAQRAGVLEEIGGASYLASLLDGVPRNLNVEYYAQIIKEKALLRRLILSSSRIIQDSYDQKEDADELLNAAQTAIVEIAEQRIKPGFRPMHALTGPDPGDDPEDGRRARRPSPACPPASAISTP